MKYISTNQLHDFEFHDSEWTLDHLTRDTLVVFIKHLNIHKGTVQNDTDSDMEIELAKVTFQGFDVQTFEPGRTWKMDASGKSYTDEPLIIFTGEEARSKLVNELQYGLTLLHLEKDDTNVYSMDAIGDSPFFAAQFVFDSVTVEWDAYHKKAWYELHRQYKRQLHLVTPGGEQKMDARIICHDEDVYYNGVLQKAPIINVGIKYNGQELWGRGHDHLWVDAFADLQKQLPQDVTIKCCLTCRYGNMCPVGNKPDELFCTKDVLITQKSDLYFYTEDDTEREKRSRGYTCICGEYQSQTENYYTYNDYIYQLNK